MDLYEWLLVLHVLAAFAWVAGVVCYGVALAGDAQRRALGLPALALSNTGAVGTLVLGIWLAIEVDGYELWDGWVIAALVLWGVAGAADGPLSRGLREGTLEPRRARTLYAVMALATFGLLLDMIFKPGA